MSWLGVVLDMLVDNHTVVGVDAGLDTWDSLLIFFPFLAAEVEDDALALLFLFQRGVQIILLEDVDDDNSGVILELGGVFWLLIGEVDGGVLPTAPSACSR